MVVRHHHEHADRREKQVRERDQPAEIRVAQDAFRPAIDDLCPVVHVHRKKRHHAGPDQHQNRPPAWRAPRKHRVEGGKDGARRDAGDVRKPQGGAEWAGQLVPDRGKARRQNDAEHRQRCEQPRPDAGGEIVGPLPADDEGQHQHRQLRGPHHRQHDATPRAPDGCRRAPHLENEIELVPLTQYPDRFRPIEPQPGIERDAVERGPNQNGAYLDQLIAGHDPGALRGRARVDAIDNGLVIGESEDEPELFGAPDVAVEQDGEVDRVAGAAGHQHAAQSCSAP